MPQPSKQRPPSPTHPKPKHSPPTPTDNPTPSPPIYVPPSLHHRTLPLLKFLASYISSSAPHLHELLALISATPNSDSESDTDVVIDLQEVDEALGRAASFGDFENLPPWELLYVKVGLAMVRRRVLGGGEGKVRLRMGRGEYGGWRERW